MATGLRKLCATLSIAATLVVGAGSDLGRVATAQGDGAQIEAAEPSISEALKYKLLLAFSEKDAARLLALLEDNPTVADFVFRNGASLLGRAAYMGSLEAVELLLKRGANPDLGDPFPMMLAIDGANAPYDPDINPIEPRVPHYKIVVELIEQGANYGYSEEYEMLFIRWMMLVVCRSKNYKEEHLDVFREYNGKYNVEKKYIEKMEAYSDLAELGFINSSCLSHFLERFVPPGRELNNVGAAAIARGDAASAESAEAKAKADAEAKAKAKAEAHPELEEKIWSSRDDGSDDGLVSLLKQHPDLVDFMLEDDGTLTVLSLASGVGNLEAVQLLLNRGADPDIGNYHLDIVRPTP